MAKFALSLIGAVAALAMIAAPASAGEENNKTIVDKVVGISGTGFDHNAGDFDILREAVVATGLDGLLDGKRQLAVFAPPDQAFLDLTGAASEHDAFNGVAALGLPAVKQVLRYHVAPGRR